MDELIKRITERTGISEDQARTAVTTVTGFLKEKLPAPIAGQVDNAISGPAVPWWIKSAMWLPRSAACLENSRSSLLRSSE